MNVGDWITLHIPGIWRVYRVLHVGHEMRFSLSEHRKKSTRVILFSTRLVDAAWQRAFKSKPCEQGFAHPLNEDDQRRLERLINEEPTLLQAFELYIPKPIDLIVNLSMCVPDFATLDDFCVNALGPVISTGMSMEDVLQMLQKAGLDRYVGKFPINATLQIACRDHEVKDGEFILRDCCSLRG